MSKNKGIAFLEIVIVMVALTLFASVIVPQFSKAASESRTSRLCRILQDVRSYITIYKAQHKNALPGQGSCSLTEAICCRTDVNGNKVSDEKVDSGIILGPYMSKVPCNPYNGLNTVDIDGKVGDGSHGWYFNSKTGIFSADDTVEHSQL